MIPIRTTTAKRPTLGGIPVHLMGRSKTSVRRQRWRRSRQTVHRAVVESGGILAEGIETRRVEPEGEAEGKRSVAGNLDFKTDAVV